jgi:hypothetical protein
MTPGDWEGDGLADTLEIGLTVAVGTADVGAGLGVAAEPQAATSMARLPVIATRLIALSVRRVVI